MVDVGAYARRWRAPGLFAAALLLSACAAPPTTVSVDKHASRASIVPGYLPPREVLDGLAILPPPPAPGSAAQAADDAAYFAAIAARGSPRWQLAIRDAEERNPADAMENFSCALGVNITAQSTPNLLLLMRRSMTDIGAAYDKVKEHYRRPRPYVAHHGPNCTPGDPNVRPQRSYPSGHAATGWGLALLLVEVAPERATQIARRGREFAQSRVVCGVHWQSDVDAGRDIGAAVVAQLHAHADFRAQLDAARREVAAARAAYSKPAADCAAEAAALGEPPS